MRDAWASIAPGYAPKPPGPPPPIPSSTAAPKVTQKPVVVQPNVQLGGASGSGSVQPKARPTTTVKGRTADTTPLPTSSNASVNEEQHDELAEIELEEQRLQIEQRKLELAAKKLQAQRRAGRMHCSEISVAL